MRVLPHFSFLTNFQTMGSLKLKTCALYVFMQMCAVYSPGLAGELGLIDSIESELSLATPNIDIIWEAIEKHDTSFTE